MTMVADAPVEVTHERRFPVVEIFGPTIQGEGPETGLRVGFIRFGGCDYRCHWCDTDIAVLPDKVRLADRLTAQEIFSQVNMTVGNVGTIILSGGNPGLLELWEVVDGLHGLGYRVSIETQGSIWKEWMRRLDQIVVSPKPPSAGYGGVKTWGEIDSFVALWSGKGLGNDMLVHPPLAFKVPCLDEGDVTFAGNVADSFPGIPMFLSVVTRSGGLDGTFVWNQPYHHGNDTQQDVIDRYRQIIELSHENPHLRDARVIPQLHYLLWGAERGR